MLGGQMILLGHSPDPALSVTLLDIMRARNSAQVRRSRRLRSLAHQCPQCRALWALTVVIHPSGPVVLCRECGHVRAQHEPERELRLV